jgi:hypothetical protein
MPDIQKLYEHVELWHGTGRYKYSAEGGIVDILKGIITDGGIVPHDDDWDRKRGKIQSISLARTRMYARLYACMYLPNGQRIRNEYLSRWFWGYYFFGTAKLVAYIEYPFQRHVPGYKKKIREWTEKVSKKKHSLISIFLTGTDIPNNYPLLIGIRQGVVHPVPGSRFFNLHECRSESSIQIGDFTHIEVPQDNVEETESLLRAAGYDTSVIPIEQGEEYCRLFSFWQLVNGKPLV